MPRVMTRLPPVVKMAIGILVLVFVGLIAKGAISPGPPTRCVFSCAAPPTATPLQTGATFSSPTYGFSFAYPSVGQRVSVGGDGVTSYVFGDSSGHFAGQILVGAGAGHEPLSYLVDGAARSLGSEISNMSLVGPMVGAEIGFESGVGNLYTGEFTDSVGNVYPVQVGILAVLHGNEWVYMVGIGSSSSSHQQSPIFGVFDEILDQWRWAT
jgi:hypothetical protein